MDTWSDITEFFAAGLFTLPTVLGIGLDSFEVFVAALGLMQILFVCIALGAPTVHPENERQDGRKTPHR